MKKLFLLALPMLMFSCSSSDDDNTSVVPPVVDGVAYFRGNVDGVATDYTYNYNSLTSFYGYSNSSDGFPGETWYSYGGAISPASDYSPAFSIDWDNMYYGGSQGENDSFYDTFATIPTNYLTNAQVSSHLKGVEVGFERNGNYYTSTNGSQTGSTFVVTSATEGIEEGGTAKIKTIIGTLNCTLYNEIDATDVITITNGSFKIIVTVDLF